jgi:hypothetical protein
MTPFQVLALTLLAGALAVEVRRCWPRPRRRRAGWWRGALLAAAAVAIVEPSLVQWLAVLLGVGRGADAVLYLVALAFLLVSFYFYARYVRLQRQLTQVVRHLALQEARRGVPEVPAD